MTESQGYLEGEEECSGCGLHPTDDSSWRIAGRFPAILASKEVGDEGA